MAKKLVTIDVNDENLKVSAKPVKAKETKVVESTEMEKLGFVEINNTVASKKGVSSAAKGFEKNLSEGTKKAVKSQTSQVEDYFDFSFRTNEKAKTAKDELSEKKTVAKKTATKATTKTATKTSNKTTAKAVSATKTEVKVEECNANSGEELKQSQATTMTNSLAFDSEVCQIIRVARIGSLFDCDKHAIQA